MPNSASQAVAIAKARLIADRNRCVPTWAQLILPLVSVAALSSDIFQQKPCNPPPTWMDNQFLQSVVFPLDVYCLFSPSQDCVDLAISPDCAAVKDIATHIVVSHEDNKARSKLYESMNVGQEQLQGVDVMRQERGLPAHLSIATYPSEEALLASHSEQHGKIWGAVVMDSSICDERRSSPPHHVAYSIRIDHSHFIGVRDSISSAQLAIATILDQSILQFRNCSSTTSVSEKLFVKRMPLHPSGCGIEDALHGNIQAIVVENQHVVSLVLLVLMWNVPLTVVVTHERIVRRKHMLMVIGAKRIGYHLSWVLHRAVIASIECLLFYITTFFIGGELGNSGGSIAITIFFASIAETTISIFFGVMCQSTTVAGFIGGLRLIASVSAVVAFRQSTTPRSVIIPFLCPSSVFGANADESHNMDVYQLRWLATHCSNLCLISMCVFSLAVLLDHIVSENFPLWMSQKNVQPSGSEGIGGSDGLSCHLVGKTFGFFKRVDAVREFSVDFPSSGVFVLRGKNGAGKSTALNILSRFFYPDCGTVALDAVSIGDRHYLDKVSYCPQDTLCLLPYLNGLETLQLCHNIQGVGDSTETCLSLLASVGLDQPNNISKNVCDYSGGMSKKLMMLVCLVGTPNLLLLDEVTTGLDAATRKLLYNTLDKMSSKCCIVIASHDEMDEVPDAWIRCHMKNGRLVEMGARR